jgi:hypothetical protein
MATMTRAMTVQAAMERYLAATTSWRVVGKLFMTMSLLFLYSACTIPIIVMYDRNSISRKGRENHSILPATIT